MTSNSIDPDSSLFQSNQISKQEAEAYLCWAQSLRRLCIVWKQERLQEWATFPLGCLRMEARQQQQSSQRYARRSGRRTSGRRNGHIRPIRLLSSNHSLKQCQIYRTMSFMSHPRKILLRVILNRFKVKGEELVAEEEAGFRPGRSTVEQILNSQSSWRSTYNSRPISSTTS